MRDYIFDAKLKLANGNELLSLTCVKYIIPLYSLRPSEHCKLMLGSVVNP